jgi:hypothetical protein
VLPPPRFVELRSWIAAPKANGGSTLPLLPDGPAAQTLGTCDADASDGSAPRSALSDASPVGRVRARKAMWTVSVERQGAAGDGRRG